MNGEKLVVYNWGEYIDPEVLTMFEEETGIDIVYEEFETNEILYPKISSGAIAYDAVSYTHLDVYKRQFLKYWNQ